MDKIIIQRAVSSFFAKIWGLSGVWLCILLFAHKSIPIIVGGLFFTVFVVILYLMQWCRAIIIENDQIVLKKLFSAIVIKKDELLEFNLVPKLMRFTKKSGVEFALQVNGFKEKELIVLKEHLEKLYK